MINPIFKESSLFSALIYPKAICERCEKRCDHTRSAVRFYAINMKNKKRFSSGVAFADIGADDATGTVEEATDGGQTTLTGQVADQATMQVEKVLKFQTTLYHTHLQKSPLSNHTYICYY